MTIAGLRRKGGSLYFCVGILSITLWAEALEAETFNVVSNPPIPGSIRSAFDVRYADRHTVVLACGKQGTLQLSTEGATATPVLLIGTSGAESVWDSYFLGLSHQFIVTAGPAFQVAWVSRGPSPHWGQMEIDSPESVDVWKDRLLLVGFRKGEDGQGLPDGSIAWVGSLSKGLADLKPVAYASKTGSANPMGLWAPIQAGKGRFLADGSFLIVPGVEPGVFLYRPDGRLSRTWDSARLGIDLCCNASPSYRRILASSMAVRANFVNAQHWVDEILPLPQGPALLIRRVENNEVRWAVKILHADGTITDAGDLPLATGSPNWHIRGDVLGNRIVVLLRDFPAKNLDTFAHPRLVQLEVSP